MAHFRTEMKGNRGWVSRTGTKNSGMQVHIHGWNMGIKVYIINDEVSGEDVAYIHTTGGTNDPNEKTFVAAIMEGDTQ